MGVTGLAYSLTKIYERGGVQWDPGVWSYAPGELSGCNLALEEATGRAWRGELRFQHCGLAQHDQCSLFCRAHASHCACTLRLWHLSTFPLQTGSIGRVSCSVDVGIVVR